MIDDDFGLLSGFCFSVCYFLGEDAAMNKLKLENKKFGVLIVLGIAPKKAIEMRDAIKQFVTSKIGEP